jgi:hypothetical protein
VKKPPIDADADFINALLPEITRNGPVTPLERWQLALVLDLVNAQIIKTPCAALMLVANCSHDEAHDAFTLMFAKLGTPLAADAHEGCPTVQ